MTDAFETFVGGVLGKRATKVLRYPQDYPSTIVRIFLQDNPPDSAEMNFLREHFEEARKNPEIRRLIQRNNETRDPEEYFAGLERVFKAEKSQIGVIAERPEINPKFSFRQDVQRYPCGHETTGRVYQPYRQDGKTFVQCPLDGKEWEVKIILGKQVKDSPTLSSPSDNALNDKELLAHGGQWDAGHERKEKK